MTKSFKLKNLGCANCAAKMEREISKLPGVNSARVNFMMQKLSLDCQDDALAKAVEQAQTIIKKIEPDCAIIM